MSPKLMTERPRKLVHLPQVHDPSQQIRLIQVELVASHHYGKNREGKVKNWELPGYSRHYVGCRMTRWMINEAPEYTAVSYVWGNEEFDRWLEIRALGSLCVGRNAYDAILSADQYTDGGYLWIDSVCINQRDRDEKAAQVRMMGRIYNTAQAVLSYVGDHDESSRSFFNALHTQEFQDVASEIAANPDFQLGLISFSQRTYWTRLWIIQECIAARRLYFICEYALVSSTDLTLAVAAACDYLDPDTVTSLQLSRMCDILYSKQRWTFGMDFETAILRFGQWECKDLRDCVFGILYLVEWAVRGPEPIEPNYNLSKEAVAMCAFRHCTSSVGAQAVCDSLRLGTFGDGGLMSTILECFTSFADIRSILGLLGVSRIEDLEMIRAVRLCRTSEDVLMVWQWLSEDFNRDQRLQLLGGTIEACSGVVHVGDLSIGLTQRLSLPNMTEGDKVSTIRSPVFYQTASLAERSEIFFRLAHCAGSLDEIQALLQGLKLPGVGLVLAQRIFAVSTARNRSRWARGMEREEPLKENSPSASGELLALISNCLCSDIDNRDRIRLAMSLVHLTTKTADIAVVLRVLDIPPVPLGRKDLSLLLDGTILCFRRLVVFCQAMSREKSFNVRSVSISAAEKKSLWARFQRFEKHEDRRNTLIGVDSGKKSPHIPSLDMRTYSMSLCGAICISKKVDYEQYLGLKAITEKPSTVATDSYYVKILGCFGGIWIVAQDLPTSTIMVGLASFPNDQWIRKLSRTRKADLCKADLCMSMADVRALAWTCYYVQTNEHTPKYMTLSHDSSLEICTIDVVQEASWLENLLKNDFPLKDRSPRRRDEYAIEDCTCRDDQLAQSAENSPVRSSTSSPSPRTNAFPAAAL